MLRRNRIQTVIISILSFPYYNVAGHQCLTNIIYKPSKFNVSRGI